MNRIYARTYVQWAHPVNPNITESCLVCHINSDMDYLKRQFIKLAKIYNGMHGDRVYTVLVRTTILFDTARGDWIPYEVRRVRESKNPHLLIGRLKTKQGIDALEQRFKGENDAEG